MRCAHEASLLTFLFKIAGNVCIWFGASIFISFSNKHLLTGLDFPFPFFLTFCTNAGVAMVTWLVTRLKPFRQEKVSRRAFIRFIMPLAGATTLDIGFSNWSLVLLPVAIHVIIKGSGPLFVMICGMGLGVEGCSRRTPIAILLIVIGLTLVVTDKFMMPDRPLGFILGMVSVSFTGLRWALAQLLTRGRLVSVTEDAPRAIRRMTPLATMLYTTPVIAAGALLCSLATPHERRVVKVLLAYSEDDRLQQLLLYLSLLVLLVWAVSLAEFQIVQLTSSLTLAVFGVLKEVLTVLVAVLAGDLLTPINVLGLGLCIAGNVFYFLEKTNKHEVEDHAEVKPVLTARHAEADSEPEEQRHLTT